MTAKDWFRALVCIVLCLGIGAVGSYATVSQIPGWYAQLTKPIWTPPNALFPIAWTILYVMIAVSLWLLWSRTPASPARSLVLVLFLVQLALNAAWSPVFFGAHAIMMGLAVIVALVVVLAFTLRKAFRINKAAAWLLVPYLAWVCYAATLNAGIAILNPSA